MRLRVRAACGRGAFALRDARLSRQRCRPTARAEPEVVRERDRPSRARTPTAYPPWERVERGRRARHDVARPRPLAAFTSRGRGARDPSGGGRVMRRRGFERPGAALVAAALMLVGVAPAAEPPRPRRV